MSPGSLDEMAQMSIEVTEAVEEGLSDAEEIVVSTRALTCLFSKVIWCVQLLSCKL